ncbi:MAG: hypothetical protein REI94_12870 [Moraxellaceae bacterium]|nr:hypothetical protein [Moraxellaceae bacterium]
MTLKTTALALALTAVLAACASSGSNTQSTSSAPAPAASSTSSTSTSTSASSTAAKPAAGTTASSSASTTSTANTGSGNRGRNQFPVADATQGPSASKFAGVKLYFGKQKSPAVARSLGEDRTSVRTNSFNKTPREACSIALASALIRFQDAARRKGADAVINIRSNYDNVEFSSETNYECEEGALMAGVALKGEFVKLK